MLVAAIEPCPAGPMLGLFPSRFLNLAQHFGCEGGELRLRGQVILLVKLIRCFSPVCCCHLAHKDFASLRQMEGRCGRRSRGGDAAFHREGWDHRRGARHGESRVARSDAPVAPAARSRGGCRGWGAKAGGGFAGAPLGMPPVLV